MENTFSTITAYYSQRRQLQERLWPLFFVLSDPGVADSAKHGNISALVPTGVSLL
jgi:hypothetical protein